MNELITGLIISAGIPLVGYLVGIWLPRKQTYKWGLSLGTLFRTISFEKLGHNVGNKLVDIVTNTLSDFFEGLLDGSKGDNKYVPNN